MKSICFWVSLLLTVGLAGANAAPPNAVLHPMIWTDSKFNYRPPNGCVPDAKTAFKIANAILLAAYGERAVEFNKPFAAILRKGVWTVGGMGYQEGMDGGGMEIDISKSDGRILRIYAGM